MSDHRSGGERLSRPAGKRTRRAYRLGARAEQQALTRRRIAQAAVELHGTVGPANTTIRAIADRAGVERLTVYRHFPDERALYAACSGQFLEQHPPPDLSEPMTIASPVSRVEAVVLTLYRYYRETEPMLAALMRDAATVPLVGTYLEPYLNMLGQLAGQLATGMPDAPDPRATRAAIGHALAFTTWRSLAIDEGLSDTDASALMSTLIQATLNPTASPQTHDPRS